MQRSQRQPHRPDNNQANRAHRGRVDPDPWITTSALHLKVQSAPVNPDLNNPYLLRSGALPRPDRPTPPMNLGTRLIAGGPKPARPGV